MLLCKKLTCSKDHLLQTDLLCEANKGEMKIGKKTDDLRRSPIISSR